MLSNKFKTLVFKVCTTSYPAFRTSSNNNYLLMWNIRLHWIDRRGRPIVWRLNKFMRSRWSCDMLVTYNDENWIIIISFFSYKTFLISKQNNQLLPCPFLTCRCHSFVIIWWRLPWYFLWRIILLLFIHYKLYINLRYPDCLNDVDIKKFVTMYITRMYHFSFVICLNMAQQDCGAINPKN